MEIFRENAGFTLRSERYSLVFLKDRPFVYLNSPTEQRIAELFIFSSVHPLNGRDDTYQTGEWTVHETPSHVDVSCVVRSTAWKSKIYRFRCYPERLTYHIEIEGQGALDNVLYFGGHYSDSLRWGSGFFWSGQRFSQVFNPEPNIPEIYHHGSGEGSKIDLMGVPIPAKGDWFFTPPPFCFAGQYGDGWVGMGVEAQAGENSFTEYHYHGSQGAFYLSLSYEGHTQVNGVYQLPAIGFDFAADEYSALKAHVTALRADRLVSIPEHSESPSWWRKPIFCGWGAQCYLASLQKGHSPSYARQEFYEHFLISLEQNGLQPGTVVLDDKWQATYGKNAVDEDKWPNLRGFVDEQHAQGRHVLLWLKAWDPEGLPVEECVTHAGGLPIAFDPTNPAFEKRLRESVRRMLSSDGYDADGFKIDFTARIPSGYGLHIHEEVWGLELMRRYLSILYSEAKKVKPDALIMSHTPHPYLANVVDMIRLNDINIGTDVNRAMIHRAKVASIACPEAIIDTDNWPITDKTTWQAYLRIQPELGIPSLYFATHIDFTQEALTPEDYALIRQVWADAVAKQSERLS
jgi:hypothetical protein